MPSQAPRPPAPSICPLSNSSFFSSLGAAISNGANAYKTSTDVLKIRSSTSASVVYSSRMKFSNADPVDFSTVPRESSAPFTARHREKAATQKIVDACRNVSDQPLFSLAVVHLDLDDPLLVSIPEERVLVCFAVHRDPRPSELFDRDQRLVDVSVLGDEVGREVQTESLRAQDVRGNLGQICSLSITALLVFQIHARTVCDVLYRIRRDHDAVVRLRVAVGLSLKKRPRGTKGIDARLVSISPSSNTCTLYSTTWCVLPSLTTLSTLTLSLPYLA